MVHCVNVIFSTQRFKTVLTGTDRPNFTKSSIHQSSDAENRCLSPVGGNGAINISRNIRTTA